MVVYIDTETYCETPLTGGLYRYHEQSEIILSQWAVDDYPVHVAEGTPPEFLAVLKAADIIVAHNSAFERVKLEQIGAVPRHDTRWRDTMAIAMQHSLPGGLGILSDIYRLGIDKAKDKAGRRLIQLFCKPVKGKRVWPREAPGEWRAFKEYARLDVVAMRDLYAKLPKWNRAIEMPIWRLDQAVNDRGMLVDCNLATAAVQALTGEKTRANEAMRRATHSAVGTAMQRDALLGYIETTYAIKIPDLQKSTVERRLSDPNLPDAVKELLLMRQGGSGTGTAKYKTLLSSVSGDNRLRGALQYCGAARTGRWSGRRFQPQNLPRPARKQKLIDIGIEALRGGYADLIFESVSGIASDCVRGCVIAPRAKKLVVSDLSAIEGRVLAWLAGENYKLRVYEEIDQGVGADVYQRTYAQVFGTRAENCTKNERQLGKVLELAFGYGGGVGAFVTFAAGFRVNLDELAHDMHARIPVRALREAEQWYDTCIAEHRGTYDLQRSTFIVCDAIKRLWRWANPETVQAAHDLERAVKSVLAGECKMIPVRDKLLVDRRGLWLRIKLPSGRYMCYPAAHLKEGKIVYRGIDTYTKKWGDIYTYGGKLIENVTQATARDIMVLGMLRAEQHGYRIVLTVHDEIVAEVPNDPQYSHLKLSEFLSAGADWTHGLPLAAEGFEGFRYRK